MADLSQQVRDFFTDTLPSRLNGYEQRPSQLEMAELITEGFLSGEHVLCEAGTGTGKSLAYLVPAVLWALESGEKVIVSTGTIALQEQLIQKDIPFLAEHIGAEFSVGLAKGKGNYLCLRRLDDEMAQLGLALDEEIARLSEWARSTNTGDRADLDWSPVNWDLVSADDTCNGARCSYFSRCFLFKARARLEKATLIVCNHALLALDIRLRRDSEGNAFILPDSGAVVLDEAHEFETVAVRAMGVDVSTARWPWLAARIRKLETYSALDPAQRVDADSLMRDIDNLWKHFFQQIAAGFNGPGSYRLEPRGMAASDLLSALRRLQKVLRFPEATCEAEEKHNLVVGLIGGLVDDITFILEDAREGWVTWVEVAYARQSGSRSAVQVTLHATPVEVGDILSEDLFRGDRSVVLTSATLAVDGGFGFVKQRLGLESAREAVLDSPFDFSSQCGLYVPSHLPEPNDPKFPQQAVAEIERILHRSGGRAFLLFTSYRLMETAHNALAGRLPWTVLKQGDLPRGKLIERFKSDTTSVLFATMSFWTGVDVPGEALSCVIMDRIPFTVPDDPVSKARSDAVEARGGSSFFELSVPEAAVRLKQGFGRLIRSQSDTGLVAILDTRLFTKRYGKALLRSLPDVPVYRNLAEVPERLFGEPQRDRVQLAEG